MLSLLQLNQGHRFNPHRFHLFPGSQPKPTLKHTPHFPVTEHLAELPFLLLQDYIICTSQTRSSSQGAGWLSIKKQEGPLPAEEDWHGARKSSVRLKELQSLAEIVGASKEQDFQLWTVRSQIQLGKTKMEQYELLQVKSLLQLPKKTHKPKNL